jgi:hypothetical protein
MEPFKNARITADSMLDEDTVSLHWGGKTFELLHMLLQSRERVELEIGRVH